MAEYLAELRDRGIAALDKKVGAVLGLSLDRLADEDGELARRFTQLGAFPAGFDAAAAAAAWGTEPHTARDDLDLLADWSLVQVEAVGRYRLHDLVRDLAVARAAPAALEEARARHAGHYAGVLARADELYLSGGAGVLQGLALFDAERANVEAGQRWAAGNAGGREDAAALAARYPDAGVYVLDLRLTPRQLIEWHDAALAACRWLRARRGEGAALNNLGLAWADLKEPLKAIGYFEQALAIAREVGDRRWEGYGLGNLGTAWRDLNEPREAIGFFEQALKIARATGNRRSEANALGNVGLAWMDLNEPRKAASLHEQALTLASEVGDSFGEANGQFNIALAHERLGERDKAIAAAKAALVIYRAIKSSRVADTEAWLRERDIEP